jgi:hypothetical protein
MLIFFGFHHCRVGLSGRIIDNSLLIIPLPSPNPEPARLKVKRGNIRKIVDTARENL